MQLTLEMWFPAGHVDFDGLNLSQVSMLMVLFCGTVRPEMYKIKPNTFSCEIKNSIIIAISKVVIQVHHSSARATSGCSRSCRPKKKKCVY